MEVGFKLLFKAHTDLDEPWSWSSESAFQSCVAWIAKAQTVFFCGKMVSMPMLGSLKRQRKKNCKKCISILKLIGYQWRILSI